MVMAYSAQYRVTVILGGAAGFESPNGQVRLLIVHGAKPPANTADEFERPRSLSRKQCAVKAVGFDTSICRQLLGRSQLMWAVPVSPHKE